jgi:threonine/homoserine/homoserine lactone efflux protein
MFNINNYFGFVMAIVGFQILPGPGTLTILNATARKFSRLRHARLWANRFVGMGLLGFSLKLAINRK